MKSPRVSLAALLGAQAQVTFNDNAARIMLLALAQYPGVLGDTDPNLVRGLLSALLVAPFVAFSSVAGWVVDRFPKSRVLGISLAAQVVIMVVVTAALWRHAFGWAVAGLVLLAVQATVFAPAKRGILREMVDAAGLSRSVGLMEMLGVGFILVGISVGGWLFDRLTRLGLDRGLVPVEAAWTGAWETAAVLALLSIAVWLLFPLLVTPTRAQSAEPFRPGLFWQHGRQLAELWQDRLLRRATYGIMFFYAIGAYLLVLLVQLGADLHLARTSCCE